MMKRNRMGLTVGLLVGMLFCGGILAAQEKEDVNSNVREQSVSAVSSQVAPPYNAGVTNYVERPILDQIGEKLGRGIINVGFGPLEILIQPYDVANDKGALAALSYGVLRGVFFTVVREVLGVVDIVTFFMPLPGATWDPNDAGWGYGPYLRPAWVVDVDHNAFNFFYREQAVVTTE